MDIVLNSNWFSLLIPALVIYMAKYHTLKYDYEYLQEECIRIGKFSTKKVLENEILKIENSKLKEIINESTNNN